MLLHYHKKLHTWLQFGGHIELDENPWQAIRHETTEESGYDLDQLEVLQPPLRLATLTGAILHPVAAYHNTHSFPGFPQEHFHSDLGYIFVTTQPPKNSPAQNESTRLKLFTAQEIAQWDNIPSSVREAALFMLSAYLTAWETVPISDFT